MLRTVNVNVRCPYLARELCHTYAPPESSLWRPPRLPRCCQQGERHQHSHRNFLTRKRRRSRTTPMNAVGPTRKTTTTARGLQHLALHSERSHDSILVIKSFPCTCDMPVLRIRWAALCRPPSESASVLGFFQDGSDIFAFDCQAPCMT